MYEELVKRLRTHNGWALNKTLDEAADAIEELSRLHEAQRQNLITLMNEDPEMEWIPVTERLPKEMVLAHGRDGDIRSLEYSFTKKW